MQCIGLSALGCKPRSIGRHAHVPALGNNAGGIFLTVFTTCSSALCYPCSSLRISISIFSISRPSLRHFAILNYSALALPPFPTQRIEVSLNCSRYLYFSSWDVKKGLCNVGVKSQCEQLSIEKQTFPAEYETTL